MGARVQLIDLSSVKHVIYTLEGTMCFTKEETNCICVIFVTVNSEETGDLSKNRIMHMLIPDFYFLQRYLGGVK